MSNDARILVELLDQLIRFDFSEIRYMDIPDDEKEVMEKQIALRLSKDILKISSNINSVIDRIKENNFVGFTQEHLLRCKEKLESINHFIDTDPDYKKYLDLGERGGWTDDVHDFLYIEVKLSKFIEQLEKHILDSRFKYQEKDIISSILESPTFDKTLVEYLTELAKYLPDIKKIYSCPITSTIMEDPVICSDGHTYERKAIEEWLRTNNKSPNTNDVLSNKVLIPNIALRQAIERYKVLFEAKKAGAGYKRRKMKTRRQKSKNIRKSRKTKK
jgi:hypothetical protein